MFSARKDKADKAAKDPKDPAKIAKDDGKKTGVKLSARKPSSSTGAGASKDDALGPKPVSPRPTLDTQRTTELSTSVGVPQTRAPAASHFASDSDNDSKPTFTSPEKLSHFVASEKQQSHFASPEPSSTAADKDDGKRKGARKTKVKSKSAASTVRQVEVPVDETDKKKGVSDIRDLQLLEPSDPTQTWELAYNNRVWPDEVGAAYAKLLQLARNANAGPVPVPEFVLMGHVGSGKSSLVELMTGQAASNAVGSSATTRPVFFQWLNNRTIKASQQRIVVKRDPQSGVADYERDVEVAGGLGALEAELRRRMAASAKATWPIYVTLESSDTLNYTIIDAPGLGQTAALDGVAVALASVAHRHIVAVQRATPEPDNALLAVLGPLDPELARTTLVYTGFFDVLRAIQTPEALGRFISRTPEDAHRFFTSLPFFSARGSLNTAAEFREIVFKMVHRDLAALEKLQVDKRLLSSVGTLSLRAWIHSTVWKRFQQHIPALLLSAQENLSVSRADLALVRKQSDSLTNAKLRALASNYTTEYLQCVGSLLAGTAEGNTVINGETLDDEKKAHGDAVWRTSTNMPLAIKDSELDVPLRGSKLYGGQQLERLLAEFMAVASRSELAEPSMADVANAAGINKLSNTTDVTWAASDLAQLKSRDALVPLLKQLASRSAYVMKRLGEISRRMMENRRRENAADHKVHHHGVALDNVDDATRYAAFRHFVREAFEKFVDQQAQVMLAKCMDEFYSTRTIHFSCSEEALAAVGDVDASNPDKVKSAVVAMSKHIFAKLRTRIVKNVVLKIYAFLLVPCQSALWSSLQATVSSLTDEELKRKFDVSSTLAKLATTEKTIADKMETLSQTHAEMQKSAAQYNYL